jgi:hypothetical protein
VSADHCDGRATPCGYEVVYNATRADRDRLAALNAELLSALAQVSFYAHVNHGTKAKDYGEVVDPALKKAWVPTGQLFTPAESARLAAIAKARAVMSAATDAPMTTPRASNERTGAGSESSPLLSSVPAVTAMLARRVAELQAENVKLRAALTGFLAEFGDKAENANVIRARAALKEPR